MKLGFIICEYNPMHNGHLYQLSKTKEELGLDGLVLIMSGSTVQRGEFSIVDKYEKAQLAIKAGADVVIELPTYYVLSSAENFAYGGVKIASSIKSEESYLSFGSECGDTNLLFKSVDIKNSKNYIEQLKKELKQGNSFVKSQSDALILDGIDENIISNPNNILGLEYINQILRQKSNLIPYTILRNKKYSSSSKIREKMENKKNYKKDVPSFVYKAIYGNNIDINGLYSILINCILTKKTTGIANINGVIEGLENKIYKEAQVSSSYEELLNSIKSKRYTLSRLKRILLSIILDISSENYAPYMNILASNNSRVLGYIIKNSTLKTVTKYSDSVKLNKKELNSFELDQKAYRLQETLLHKTNKDINKKYNMRKENE